MKKTIEGPDRLVIVQDEAMVEEFVGSMPLFIRQFLHTQEKQVTVIYPGANRLAPSVAYKDGGIPVRIIPSVDTPPIQMSRHVLRLLGKPIFATSCLVAEGHMPPSYEEINPLIKSTVELISPLLFGIDESVEYSMVIKYDHHGHISVVRK